MQRRKACCSYCRKDYRDVGPLVEGPGEIYICGQCIELGQRILDQERRRRAAPCPPLEPAQIREKLDHLVIGQGEAKQTLALAAGCRSQGGGRVLLIGPSLSSQIFLARALAYVLDAPFAAVDASSLIKSKDGSKEVTPLVLDLLRASDFDAEAARQGVVFVGGTDELVAQDTLVRLWRDNVAVAVEGLTLALQEIVFVCGGSFGGLDEAIARRGRHAEQPITPEDLIAAGAQPDWAAGLAGIARVAPFDEPNLVRVVDCIDFGRCGDDG